MPSKQPRIHRVRSWSKERHGHAVADSDGDMKTIGVTGHEENRELDQARQDGAAGRQESSEERESGQQKDQQSPDRSAQRPLCCTVDNQGRSNGSPQKQQRSACCPGGKHGEESLHRPQISPAKRAEQRPSAGVIDYPMGVVSTPPRESIGFRIMRTGGEVELRKDYGNA